MKIFVVVILATVAMAAPSNVSVVPNSYIFILKEDVTDKQAVEANKAHALDKITQKVLSRDKIKMTFDIGTVSGFVVHGLQSDDLTKLEVELRSVGSFFPNKKFKFNLPRPTAKFQYNASSRIQPSATCSDAKCCKRTVSKTDNLNLDCLDGVLDGSYCAPVLGASKMTVFVMDTGVDASHPDFNGTATAYADCNVDGLTPWTPNVDVFGHGTHVSGTIGSMHYGVTSNAKINVIKVLGDDGSGTGGTLMCGFYKLHTWLQADVKRKAVMSMSLGFDGIESTMDMAIDSLARRFQNQLVIVVAAGNSAANACGGTFGRGTNLLAVGSLSSSFVESDFSNYGKCVDITAPGEDVLSTIPGGQTASYSGTSMATPLVAGAIAQYWLDNPTKTGFQLRSNIQSAACPLFTKLPKVPRTGTPSKRVQYPCPTKCS